MTEYERNGHHGNEEVRFERRDLSSKVVLGSLFALGVFVVIVYFIVLGTYKFGDWYERTHQEPQHPMAQPAEADTRDTEAEGVTARIKQNFSQPLLETNERTWNNDYRLQEEQKLHSYGPSDEEKGAIRIPIDRAMQIIAQRGLNTTPRAGETPESVVNTISAAAEKADHSEGMASTQPANNTKAKTNSRNANSAETK